MKDQKKVLLIGGGSGGHITPLVEIASALKSKNDQIDISYIGVYGDKIAKDLIKNNDNFSSYKRVFSGKLRRYEGFKGLKKLKLWKAYLFNLRDSFLIVIGIIQSLCLLVFARPKLVFSKGGYPALPLLLVSRLLRIPVITHDSDAVSGLSHKLVAKIAKLRLFGVKPRVLETNFRHVGVPVNPSFSLVIDAEEKKQILTKYDLSDKFVLVTGGGLGSRNLNYASISIAKQVKADLLVVAGSKFFSQTQEKWQELPDNVKGRVKIVEFTKDMPSLMRAATVVVTRAGATALAEVSASARPTVIVPNDLLAGGHQTKNKEVFAQNKAALVVDDYGRSLDESGLVKAINSILTDNKLRSDLSKNIKELAIPNSAELSANAIMEFI